MSLTFDLGGGAADLTAWREWDTLAAGRGSWRALPSLCVPRARPRGGFLQPASCGGGGGEGGGGVGG